MPLSNIVNLLGRAPKLTAGSGGIGNVSGPASSTLNAVARYADTTGKVIKDSNVTLADSGTALVFSGAAGLTATGASNPVTLTPGSGGRTDISVGNLTFDTITNGTGRIQLPAATTSAGGITFGADTNFYRSGQGMLNINAASTNITLAFNQSGGSYGFIQASVGTGFIIDSNQAQPLILRTGNATALTLDTSQTCLLAKTISSYNGVATSGWGVPAIQASGRATAQSAANASISTYTVGAADGSFEVSANMNVTAATVLSTTLQVSYTDESNTARSMIFPVQQLGGSFIAGGLITATGAWESATMHIRCKASTAITVLTAAGTFNTVTYTAEGLIRQLK